MQETRKEIFENHNTKPPTTQTFNGLLLIKEFKNLKFDAGRRVFITYEGFWGDLQESTEPMTDATFNHFKVCF
jgi:hypothetical protein